MRRLFTAMFVVFSTFTFTSAGAAKLALSVDASIPQAGIIQSVCHTSEMDPAVSLKRIGSQNTTVDVTITGIDAECVGQMATVSAISVTPPLEVSTVGFVEDDGSVVGEINGVPVAVTSLNLTIVIGDDSI